jgi:hypothetical protein
MVLLPGELPGDRERGDDENHRGDALAWPHSRYQPPACGWAGVVVVGINGHGGQLPGKFSKSPL